MSLPMLDPGQVATQLGHNGGKVFLVSPPPLGEARFTISIHSSTAPMVSPLTLPGSVISRVSLGCRDGKPDQIGGC